MNQPDRLDQALVRLRSVCEATSHDVELDRLQQTFVAERPEITDTEQAMEAPDESADHRFSSDPVKPSQVKTGAQARDRTVPVSPAKFSDTSEGLAANRTTVEEPNPKSSIGRLERVFWRLFGKILHRPPK